MKNNFCSSTFKIKIKLLTVVHILVSSQHWIQMYWDHFAVVPFFVCNHCVFSIWLYSSQGQTRECSSRKLKLALKLSYCCCWYCRGAREFASLIRRRRRRPKAPLRGRAGGNKHNVRHPKNAQISEQSWILRKIYFELFSQFVGFVWFWQKCEKNIPISQYLF